MCGTLGFVIYARILHNGLGEPSCSMNRAEDEGRRGSEKFPDRVATRRVDPSVQH